MIFLVLGFSVQEFKVRLLFPRSTRVISSGKGVIFLKGTRPIGADALERDENVPNRKILGVGLYRRRNIGPITVKAWIGAFGARLHY